MMNKKSVKSLELKQACSIMKHRLRRIQKVQLPTQDISLRKTLNDSRLMKNLRMIGFTNGTMMCHGCMKNHGRIMKHGMNPHQLHIVANLSTIKLDVQSGLPMTREKMDTIMENVYDDTKHDHKYEMDHEVDERQEIYSNETHEPPVCNIRRFEMIKYSFGNDEEYVAIKEDEYDDLMSTSKDACRAYQEIFRMMDEGWMVNRDE
uniref:Uncharacterized protein n=1 Tax=Tanacetum cinerariifolium TaxID=118510 RepID=A0A6L2KBQ4_TANCI|nr:hypothetical protein [Tanacetum cinerariifolium]